MSASNDAVQLSFKFDEKEYLAATRLYFWHSKELVSSLIVLYVLFAGVLIVVNVLIHFILPLWSVVAFIFLVGVAWFHGYVIDVPRRHFRGDPKFRDEYTLIFTDSGVEFKTENIAARIAWSFYTRVIENESFYIMVYGKNIHSLSVIPKRAFRDSKQEATFRQMLRRHVDSKLKLNEGEREEEYVPKSLEPPDWR
ncbi:MAG: YcxB family protein [Acidobacteria bacterium]|nr:YcxB family protein [Acidobacteriota bacterium]MCA1627280.1 YcxB family protein [Acidobacteriota bacterium]